MKSFEQFTLSAQNAVQRAMPENYLMELKYNITINDVGIIELHVKSDSGVEFSNINMNQYYYYYQLHGSEEMVIAEIIKLCHQRKKALPNLNSSAELCRQYAVNAKIGIVNRKKNQKWLKNIPHETKANYALFIYVVPPLELSREPIIFTASIIRELEISFKRLYLTAQRNTLRAKYTITPVESLMQSSSLHQAEEQKEGFSGLYCMTNQHQCYGAVPIVFPALLEQAAAYMGDRFYVIPSSINEIIFAHGDRADYKELCKMVKSINQYHIRPEEVLSDKITAFYSN